MARCPIGRMTSQVLESIRPFAAQGVFYAWDPLAAVYLVNPDIVTLARFPVEVTASGPDAGNSRRSDAGCTCLVATNAQGNLFTHYFTAPFEVSARTYN